MLQLVIHSLEALFLVLLAFLAFRLRTLYSEYAGLFQVKQAPSISDVVDQAEIKVDEASGNTKVYEDKLDSLKLSQDFIGKQMANVKQGFLEREQEHLYGVNDAISLYVIGAVDFIARQTDCDIRYRKELIELVLKSNLRMVDGNHSNYFAGVVKRALSNGNEHMMRAGARAAKLWLNRKEVPSGYSLDEQLDEWGVMA